MLAPIVEYSVQHSSRSISILIVCLRIGPTVLSEIAKLMISSCHVLVSFEDKAEHPGPYSESALSFHVVKFIMSYYFQIIAVLGEFAGTTKFSRCIKMVRAGCVS